MYKISTATHTVYKFDEKRAFRIRHVRYMQYWYGTGSDLTLFFSDFQDAEKLSTPVLKDKKLFKRWNTEEINLYLRIRNKFFKEKTKWAPSRVDKGSGFGKPKNNGCYGSGSVTEHTEKKYN